MERKAKSDKKHRCTKCGFETGSPKGKFCKSRSPLYEANDGYVHICKDCMQSYFSEELMNFYNDDEQAIERLCQMFDLVVDQSSLVASRKVKVGTSQASTYMGKVATMSQAVKMGNSYLDTLRHRRNNVKAEEEEEIRGSVTKGMKRFWGSGYSDNAYLSLQQSYDDLEREHPEIVRKNKKLVKQLCLIEYQISMQIQNGKDVGSMSNSYKNMYDMLGLNVSGNEELEKDPIGVQIAKIEQFVPCEIYSDQSLFFDYTKLGEYMERFIFRPLKNLFTNQKIPDFEFNLEEEDGE